MKSSPFFPCSNYKNQCLKLFMRNIICHVLSHKHFKIVLGLYSEGLVPRKFGINKYTTNAYCMKPWGPN
jgi:hypothetical protein